MLRSKFDSDYFTSKMFDVKDPKCQSINESLKVCLVMWKIQYRFFCAIAFFLSSPPLCRAVACYKWASIVYTHSTKFKRSKDSESFFLEKEWVSEFITIVQLKVKRKRYCALKHQCLVKDKNEIEIPKFVLVWYVSKDHWYKIR